MLILASRSPQRRALIAVLGLPFRVVASGFEENGPGGEPRDRVLANAEGKARDVVARSGVPSGGAVVAADTEVVLDGQTLGKPADRDAAAMMLRRLAGREHTVMTAVVVVGGEARHSRVEEATVAVRPLSEAALNWYLDTGEWRERAGGYAIQGAGAVIVSGITGDPATVIGLPVGAVAELLGELDLGPFAEPTKTVPLE
jgi:septum formation protein